MQYLILKCIKWASQKKINFTIETQHLTGGLSKDQSTKRIGDIKGAKKVIQSNQLFSLFYTVLYYFSPFEKKGIVLVKLYFPNYHSKQNLYETFLRVFMLVSV